MTTATQDTILSPADLISAFRIMAFKFFPYLSSYVYALQPIERRGVGTMAIDKYGRLYYDPDFCIGLKYEEGAYVVLHEAFHLILRHCHRMGKMLGEQPTAQDRMDANIAADLVVWQAMEGVANYMPEGGVNLPDAMMKYPGIKPNMTLEEYFAAIKASRPKGPVGDKGGDGKGPVGQPMPPDKSEPGEDEQQDGEGGEADATPGAKSDKPSEEVIDDGWKPVGGGSSADGQPRDYEEKEDPNWEAFQEDEMLSRVEEKITEFEEKGSQGAMAGPHVPDCLKDAISQKLRPTPDPWKMLGAAVGLAAATPLGSPDSTYKKFSRRQHAVPGVRLTGIRKLTPRACVVLDTSGSMCDGETQAKALNVISQGLKSLGTIPVVAGDTRARSSKQVSSLKQVTWDGMGGTDMSIVLAEADKKYTPDVIVLVTDGYTPWPAKKPRYRLVIACTTDAQCPEWAVTCRIPNEVK